MPSKRWRRALAVVKDKHSLCRARVAGRNPDLEAAIVKATSHDELGVDYKNVHRVFAWVRTSPGTFLRPLLRALAKRMARTHCWVVALKGLMLAHGVLSMKIPDIATIGRLPFDLSTFRDKFSDPAKACALAAFVRAYFAYLDQRFAFFTRTSSRDAESNIETDLLELQKSQALLDLLMQIRPYSDGMRLGLVLEAMDCVVIEIFDVYSGICNAIAGVLARISRASNHEAAIVLAVLRKAVAQGDQLSSYFHVCKSMGVVNASDLPPVEQIPEEDIRDLERMLSGINKPLSEVYLTEREERWEEAEREEYWRYAVGTVVRDNWVAFHDEFSAESINGDWIARGDDGLEYKTSKALKDWNEFVQWHHQQNTYISLEKKPRNLICNL